MKKRIAFVTGGTGFIGINLIGLLLKEGWEVCALHRSTSDLTYLSRFPVSLREGSVTDLSSLREALPDRTETVFHLAGDTNLWSRRNRRQTRVNVEGTRNMLRVAHDAGVGSFIYTSSASAWGRLSDRKVSERLPQNGHRSRVNYERTKWAAEREVLRYRDTQMKVVILNPTAVSGPYDMNNWGRLFTGLKNGELPGVPDGVLSVTHVEEVVRAHLAAVDRGENGQRYLLAGVDCTFGELIREIAEVSGIKEVPGKIPTPVLRIIAYLQTAVASITGNEPTMTPELVKLMTRKNVSYCSNKAQKELGYRIRPLHTTVRDCHEWLTREGILQVPDETDDSR